MSRVAVLLAAVALACGGAASASGSVRTDFGVVGTEVPPISSSLGTFVGAAHGPIGGWGIQIRHEPLRTGPTVAITGGSLWLALRTGAALHAYNRASFGTPQSLGCVELPLESAAKVWPYTPIGTLVTIED
jgi:hypothetical protein